MQGRSDPLARCAAKQGAENPPFPAAPDLRDTAERGASERAVCQPPSASLHQSITIDLSGQVSLAEEGRTEAPRLNDWVSHHYCRTKNELKAIEPARKPPLTNRAPGHAPQSCQFESRTSNDFRRQRRR